MKVLYITDMDETSLSVYVVSLAVLHLLLNTFPCLSSNENVPTRILKHFETASNTNGDLSFTLAKTQNL